MKHPTAKNTRAGRNLHIVMTISSYRSAVTGIAGHIAIPQIECISEHPCTSGQQTLLKFKTDG